MTYINNLCADVGTVNCPCPLAETGDCLICSRLAGKTECDCRWAGVCVYNEYIQNDRVVRNKRQNRAAPVLKKIWYGSDILVIVLKVSKGFALKAAQPGAFVFLNCKGKSEFCNVPVSVMKADAEKCRIYLALKVISGKTKSIAEEEDSLIVRGVYRNGLLGEGVADLESDIKSRRGISVSRNGSRESVFAEKGHLCNPESRDDSENVDNGNKDFSDSRLPILHKNHLKRWLIITKGVGFAPAVNLLRWAEGRVHADILTDTEKVGDEIIRDYFHGEIAEVFDDADILDCSLQDMVAMSDEDSVKFGKRVLLGREYSHENYDKVVILASDYYISTLSKVLDVPAEKLIFSNNFKMCCGEGICGACGHIDSEGNVSKMCKCRNAKQFLF